MAENERKARRAAAKQAEFARWPAAADSPFSWPSPRRSGRRHCITAKASSSRRKIFAAWRLAAMPATGAASCCLGGIRRTWGGRDRAGGELVSQRAGTRPHRCCGPRQYRHRRSGRHDEAVAHFTHAMALGLRDPEILVKQSPALTAPSASVSPTPGRGSFGWPSCSALKARGRWRGRLCCWRCCSRACCRRHPRVELVAFYRHPPRTVAACDPT